jgi:hypothetical protein
MYGNRNMQLLNANNTPVGFLGAVMGAIAKANVQESIAWVRQFNLFADDFQNIELGFGDVNLDANGEFTSLNMYESISPVILDELDDSSRSSTPGARTASTSLATKPARTATSAPSPAIARSTSRADGSGRLCFRM